MLVPMFCLQESDMEKSIMYVKSWKERKEYFEYSIKLQKRKRNNKPIFGEKLNVLFKVLKSFLGVKYLEIPITTACTLKCIDCANLMQYYCSEYNYSKTKVGTINTREIIDAMDNLLKCVDYIEELHILGGEPFLNKDIYKILQYVIAEKRIKNITVVTNGTLIPSQEIIELLREKRCEIFISNYGSYSSKIDDVSRLCSIRGVRCKVLNNSQWYQSGGVESRHRTENELKKQYSRCKEFCRSLLNGRLFICPRSAHGTDLGIVNDSNVNLLELTSRRSKRKELLELENLNYILMCNYCNEGTDEYVPIQRGVQIEKND